ncbi:hypothetical protein KM043_015767 [Ampulex compressa]|nr:hypothetical protein KM043_015767 [Ampulex compressa]
MRDLGNVMEIRGMQVERQGEFGEATITQRKYTQDTMTKLGDSAELEDIGEFDVFANSLYIGSQERKKIFGIWAGENEDDDLSDLPAVSILGTLSNPASPSRSANLPGIERMLSTIPGDQRSPRILLERLVFPTSENRRLFNFDTRKDAFLTIPKETMRRFSTREKSSRIRKRSLNEKIEDSEPKIRKTDDVPVRQTRMTSKSNILNYLTKNKSRKILEKDTTDELTSDNVSTNILGPSLKSKKEDISLNVPMRTRRSRLKDQDSSSDEKTDVREEEISSHCSMKTRSRLKAQNSLTDEEIDTKKDEVTSNPSINIRKTRSMNKNVEPSTELNEESQEIQIIMQNSSLEMKIKTAEDKQEDKNGRNFKRIGKNDVKISPNKFFQSEASFEMPKSRPSRSKGVKNTKIKVEDEDVLGETSRKTRAGERSRVSSTDRENFDVSDRVNRQLKSSGGKKTLKVGFEGEGTSSEVEESTSSGFESSVDTTSTTIGRSRSGRNTSSSFLNTFSPSKIKHKVLFTGVADGTYKKILSKLGGTKIEDPMKCTVLVTDKVRRTVKFLCCLALSVPIVSIDWLLESEKSGSFLDLESYILEDPAAEAKFKFRLKDSLDKAKRQKLLEGYMVVLTPNVPPPPLQELKST